ncbi:hypothetical protein [Xanthobacter flavus]|uniref:hypothetical protein n=1 Tax=Xanthobacter flavus TaxID=281 RepID=UPI003729C7C8
MQRWFDFHPEARLDLVYRADGVPLTRLRLREPASEDAQARALLAGWVAYDNGCDFDHYGDIKSTRDYAELLAPFFPPERIRMALTSDPVPSNLDLHTQDLASNYRAARHHLEAAVLALSAAGDAAAAAAVRELFSGLRIPGQEPALMSQVALRTPRDALDEYRAGAQDEVGGDGASHWENRESNRMASADVGWSVAELYATSAGELVQWLDEVFSRSGFAKTADSQELQELKASWLEADQVYAEAVSTLIGGVDEDAVLNGRDIALAARELDRFARQLAVSRRDVIEGLDALAVRMEEWLPATALPGGAGMQDKIRAREEELRKLSVPRDNGLAKWNLMGAGETLLVLATKLERQLNQAGGVLQLGQKDARAAMDCIADAAYELDRAGTATPLTDEKWQPQVEKLDRLADAGLFRAALGKAAGDALTVDATLSVVGQLLDTADQMGAAKTWEFLARRSTEVVSRLAAWVPGLEETSKTIGHHELQQFVHVFAGVVELLTLPPGPATEGAKRADEVAQGIEELTGGLGSLSGAEARRLADLMGAAAECITSGDFMMRELRSGVQLAKEVAAGSAADLDDVLPPYRAPVADLDADAFGAHLLAVYGQRGHQVEVLAQRFGYEPQLLDGLTWREVAAASAYLARQEEISALDGTEGASHRASLRDAHDQDAAGRAAADKIAAAGAAQAVKPMIAMVETAVESVPGPSSVARQVAGVPDWKREDILRKVEAARQAMGFTKGPGSGPEVTPFEGGAIPLWRRLLTHHDVADATLAICFGLDALRRGSKVFSAHEGRLIDAADGREGLDFFVDTAPSSIRGLIDETRSHVEALRDRFSAESLWLSVIERSSIGLPFTALDGVQQLPSHVTNEIQEFVGLTAPVPGRVAPLRVVDATIPKTLVLQTRQRIAACLSAMQEQLGFAGEGGLAEMFAGQSVQILVAREVDLRKETVGRMMQRGQAVVVRLSPYKPGAGLHELAHAVDFVRTKSREERYGLMAEHGVIDSARRVYTEAGAVILGSDEVAARAGYYLDPAEVFARAVALSVAEHVQEGDPAGAAAGGSLGIPVGFDFEPDRPARDAFMAALREDFSRKRELVVVDAAPVPAM